MSDRRVEKVLLSAVVAAVLCGCRTPPDVEPYAEATTALETVIRSLSKEISSEIRSTHDGTDESRSAANELGEQFEREWSPRERVTKALGDYAQALVEVVQAGKDGRDTAAEIGTAVNGLLKTIADSYPAGSTATEAITKGVAELFARFAEHKAAKSVAQASEFAEPIIRELAILLAEDFRNLTAILNSAHTQARHAALVHANVDRNHQTLQSLESTRRATREKALSNLNDLPTYETLTRLEQLIDIELRRPWYLKYMARLAAIDGRFAARLATLDQVAVLLEAWGESHTQLTHAARTGRTPAYRVLLSLTSDLLRAYQEARKHD